MKTKLIMFSVPEKTNEEQLAKDLTTLLSSYGISSHMVVLQEEDLSCMIQQIKPCIKILTDIVKVCGNGKNKLQFISNFSKMISTGFNTQKETKIILNEIIEGEYDKDVQEFANNNNILYIFEFSKNLLGMMA